jgi:cell division protein FtsA
MAGLTVDSLIVNLTAGRLASDIYTASIDLGGQEVELRPEEGSVRRRPAVAAPGSRILHSLATGFSLDGERGIRDPLSMYGDSLGVDMHVVTAERAALKNLELSVNRAHLSVEGIVATPYASGLAALVDDEVELGCAAIDMGGGTTTISVFAEGKLVHADAVSLGGHHVTTDLARGLSTRIEDAERLKVVHASALPNSADERELISIPPIGEDDRDLPTQVPRALVSRIVRARIEETMELIRDRIQRSGFSPIVGKRVVLTGGASQLTGLPDVGAPHPCPQRSHRPSDGRLRAADGGQGPSLFDGGRPDDLSAGRGHGNTCGAERSALSLGGNNSRIARMGQWLKESFFRN